VTAAQASSTIQSNTHWQAGGRGCLPLLGRCFQALLKTIVSMQVMHVRLCNFCAITLIGCACELRSLCKLCKPCLQRTVSIRHHSFGCHTSLHHSSKLHSRPWRKKSKSQSDATRKSIRSLKPPLDPSSFKLPQRVPLLRAAVFCHQHLLQRAAVCYPHMRSCTSHSALYRS